MKIRLLTSAFNDLAEGRDFYERQGEGIGEYYLNSLFSDIDSLALYAGVHRQVYGFHRLLSKRFPCAIYYPIETGNVVVIYRVLDCRQNPRRTRKSLKPDG